MPSKVELLKCVPECGCRQTEQAGERAMRILPVVFALAEMCVDALAVDTACAEAAGDGDGDEGGASLPVLSEGCAAAVPC